MEGAKWIVMLQSSVPGPSQTDHRFDMDAEPEPIPHADDDMSVLGGGDFGDDDIEGIW